jgi:hypothetical protein
MPSKVTVPNCAEAPCKIINGQTFKFDMEFVAALPAKSLTNKVNAYLMGMNVGYKLPEEFKNTCADIKCPLLGGENLTYSLSVPVSTPVVGVTVTIEYILLNEKNDVLLCFRAPADIQ